MIWIALYWSIINPLKTKIIMTTTKTKHKYTFGYFYPTSPNSEHFKMPQGGYHVSKFADNGITLIPIKAFKSENEAARYCRQITNYSPSNFHTIDGQPLFKEGSIL